MSAILLGEMVENRTASERVLMRPNGAVIPVREYTRTWKVKTTSKADGPNAVASVVPVELFDSYVTDTESDLTALVQSREPKVTDSPYLWHVEVKYSTQTGDESRGADNPLNRPPDISWSFQKYSKPILYDRSVYVTIDEVVRLGQVEEVTVTTLAGRKTNNSAGQAFDPPVEMEDDRPTLTISRNEATFDPALPLTYNNAINTDTWYGYPPFTAKVRISATSQFESGVSFWKVTYEFELRKETWWLWVLDQGTTTYDQATGKLRIIIDDTGVPVSKPVLFNGGGVPLLKIGSWPGARSTLAAPLAAATVTAAAITDLTWFGPAPLVVQIDNELIYVTEMLGFGTLNTLRRGWGGSAAADHVAGAVVQQEPVYIPFRVYPELPFAPLHLP